MLSCPEADWKPRYRARFQCRVRSGCWRCAGWMKASGSRLPARSRACWLAWDPVKQDRLDGRASRPIERRSAGQPLGGLVFSRHGGQRVHAYDAATGDKLWSFAAQTGVVRRRSPTLSTASNMSRCGGLGAGPMRSASDGDLINRKAAGAQCQRLLVFNWAARPRWGAARRRNWPQSRSTRRRAAQKAPPAEVDLLSGRRNMPAIARCATRRARWVSTVLPDLRRAGSLESAQAWNAVVAGGMLKDNGMASFAGSLHKDEIEPDPRLRHPPRQRGQGDRGYEQGRAALACEEIQFGQHVVGIGGEDLFQADRGHIVDR